MKMSNIPLDAIDLIEQFEGFKANAYPDPVTGWKLPTIGFGTTHYPDGRPVNKGDIISKDEATDCLFHHIENLCTPALEKIPYWDKMNDNQKSALYSFAYNLGAGFYKHANFDSITNVCDSPARWNDSAWIHEQFGKYTNHGLPGLLKRRKAEADLFCKV
ncbi:MAG: lysozyme [Pseudomonadota bacterium]|nr:lysozyme [Pseudomonadota bacterium]